MLPADDPSTAAPAADIRDKASRLSGAAAAAKLGLRLMGGPAHLLLRSLGGVVVGQ